ncbi:MAG: hypothetical protein ACI8RD_002893 [Bacillariaceae sp.]|jgi:hypothetical protein
MPQTQNRLNYISQRQKSILMLASGFFLKAYDDDEPDCGVKNDDYETTAVPSLNNSTSNEGNLSSRDNIADKKTNLSNSSCAEEYAPDTSNCREADSFVNSSNHMDDHRKISVERDNKMKSCSHAGQALSASRCSNNTTTRRKSADYVTFPPCVDRMVEINHKFQPSMYSPKGVDETEEGYKVANTEVDKNRNIRVDHFRDHVRDISEPEKRLASALQDLNRQDLFIQSLARKIESTQNSLDERTQELKREQCKTNNIQTHRLQDLSGKEAKENKSLQKTISQLQIEISTLKMSSNKQDNNDKKRHEEDTLLSDNNAQNLSLKAEIVELRSRYEENMKIALNSADMVRANLKRLERERCRDRLNSSADIKCINNELIRTREESVQLKLELSRVQSLAKNEKELWEKDMDCLRKQKSESSLRDETTNYKTEIAIKSERIAELNQYEIVSNLKKELEKMELTEKKLKEKLELQKALIDDLNREKLLKSSSKEDQPLPQNNGDTSLVEMEKVHRDKISSLLANSGEGQSKTSEETSVLQEEREVFYKENVVNHEASHTGGWQYSREITDPDLCINQSKEKKQSHPLIDQSDSSPKENDTIKHWVCLKNVPSLSSRDTFSRSSKKSSLNELMNQLEVSKKRLETADERLTGLVNEGALLSVVRSPDDSRHNVSIEVVDSLDGNIEVNHHHFVDT